MSERRDYRSEIKAAAEAGDVMGLLMLATELATRAEHDDERREKEAARKRRVRGHPRTSPDVPSCPGTVTQSPPMVSPYKTPSLPPERESESAAVVASRQTVEQEMGDEFADVERFVATQGPTQRGEYWRFFASSLTSGSDGRDVAGACRDALAAAEPVRGLHAMRAFIAKHKQQRTAPVRPPPGVGGGSPPSRTGGVGNRSFVNALRAVEDA